jgi:hypothetical protein
LKGEKLKLNGLRGQLEDAGFSFHQDDNGNLHWWCWCGPLSCWDTEVGDDYPTEAEAELDALRHMIEYLKLAQAVMDEKGIVA